MSNDSQIKAADAAIDAAIPAGQLFRVELEFDADTNLLFAVVADADTPLVVDLAYLNDLIAQHKFQHLYFEQDTLKQVLSQLDEGERGRFMLAERRDAKLTIDIAEDAMRAVAHTKSAFGGTPLSKALVEHSLREAGVDPTRWDPDALMKLVTEDSVTDCEVARGLAPEDGTDSEFIPLVEGIVKHAPSEAEHGNVNQYEVFDFVVVDPGTRLMRRKPATQGVDGVDVRGTKLTCTPGKHEPFAKDMQGVVRDEADNNLLIAATKGHPIALATGVNLVEVLKLQTADLRTGNVNFDGTIYIDGDASAAVQLNASGDVVIKGSVAHATIRAGTNILIGGGVVDPDPQEEQMSQAISLEAGGNIEAKFVSGASLQANGNVTVKEYIGFSVTIAGGQVLVGQTGGKGRIYGGSCHATDAVLANRLGSNASAATLISAGLTASLSKEQSELNDAIAALEEQGKKVRFLLEKTRCELWSDSRPDTQEEVEEAVPEPPDEELCNKLSNTLEAIIAEQVQLRQSLADLEGQLGAAANASVVAATQIHAGVTLQINGVQRQFKSRDTGGTFKQQAGAIARVK